MSPGPYEAVTPYPDGVSTVSRLALTAGRCGYDGLVCRPHSDVDADCAGGVEGDSSPGDVDVVSGVEIRGADRSSVAGAIATARDRAVVVCVHGGDPGINRLACEDSRVDVLAHPMRGDGDVNHVLATAARDNDVRLEFALGPVLRSVGGSRVQALRGLRKLRDLVEKYDTPYVVSTGATGHLGLRAVRELIALGDVCGLSGRFVREGLVEWGRVAARNRDRRSDSFIEPGVRSGRYEEDR